MCVLRGEAEEALPSGKSLLIASALERHTILHCNSAELTDQFLTLG